MIKNIGKLKDRLLAADSILITAGAGMSVDSGLPSFRGVGGLYENFDDSIEEIVNPHTFSNNPDESWKYNWARLREYEQKVPHAGFASLLSICENLSLDYFVFTSNVDGHFQKAGFDGNRVYECHGNIFNIQCSKKCSSDVWNLRSLYDETILADKLHQQCIEHCIHCGELARPNVLMFSDNEWVSQPYWAQHNNYRNWELRTRRTNVVVVELGAGIEVPTVRLEGERYRGKLIRINVSDCETISPNLSVVGGAYQVLTELESIFD